MKLNLQKPPYRIYIGRGSRVLNYTVWAYRVLNSGYKAKKPSPILLKPIQFNTYKSKSNGRAGEGERKLLFRFRHPTYECKHFQPLSKIKTHKEERLVLKSRTLRALCYIEVLYRPLNAAR